MFLVQQEDFTGGGHDLSVEPLPAVQVPERFENRVYLRLGQAGAGGHAELPLDVLLGVEQDAAGLPAVPARPPGLLQVILQGAGYVGVNHQADVGFVYAHAEGVGGGDGPQASLDEALLHVLLPLRSESGVEVVGGDVLRLQEIGHLLRVVPGGAVDDGSAGLAGWQVGFQDPADVIEFLGGGGPDHHEFQVGALGPAVQHLHLNAQDLLEVFDDLLLDVGFGGGGQAEDGWRRRIAGLFPDEAADVAVVGPEVWPHLERQWASSSIQAPMSRWARALRTDLLLSCSGDISRIAASPSLSRASASARSGMDSRPFTVTQELMPRCSRLATWSAIRATRGDMTTVTAPVLSYRERAGTADRLAGPGGQNGQQVLSRHGPLDDGPLQGNAILTGGFGPEAGKSKPAGQFPLRIVALRAPLAVCVLTGRVAQQFQDFAGLGEFVQHPGRHGRVAAGHGEPGQGIGQGPALLLRVGEDALGLAGAGLTGQAAPDGLSGLLAGGPGQLSQFFEQQVETGGIVQGGQPVPGGQQVAVRPGQRLLLVLKQLEGQLGVQQRVVDPAPDQAAVLVVLDQVVVWVVGEGQGVEPEGVHRRQFQEVEARVQRGQVGQVEGDDVVSQEEPGPLGHIVQPGQAAGSAGLGCGEAELPVGVRPAGGQSPQGAVLDRDLQVQGEASPQNGDRRRRRRRRVGLPPWRHCSGLSR